MDEGPQPVWDAINMRTVTKSKILTFISMLTSILANYKCNTFAMLFMTKNTKNQSIILCILNDRRDKINN